MAPTAAVPLPEGNPMPSGPTLISQPAICAGVASLPRFGPSVALGFVAILAQPPTTSTSARQTRSRVDMLHLAARRHLPGLDGVEVEDGVVPVLGDELPALGLHGPRLVGRARFEEGRGAAPPPR